MREGKDAAQASTRGGYVVVGPPGRQGMVYVQGRYRGGAWSVRLGDVALSAGDARRVAVMLLHAAGDAP